MTDPDSVENKALDAANAVSEQVGRLWMAAHTEGMSNGMESAAQLTEFTAAAMRDDYDADPDVRAIGVAVLEQLRDQIRLCALQLPDAEVTGG